MIDIYSLYFSPNGNVKKCVLAISEGLFRSMPEGVNNLVLDITLFKNREESIRFKSGDIVVIGLPVYAGRLPNILLRYLRNFKGNGALVFAVVVYGNRHYDDALIELVDILVQCDFQVVGACAALGEHSFTSKLARNRPDEIDFNKLNIIGKHLYKSTISQNKFDINKIPGVKPYRDYYKVLDNAGNIVDFKIIKPETSENCIDCKICFNVCPMSSIEYQDVKKIGICIKCCACVNKCPTGSKEFKDANFVFHKRELEKKYINKREIEYFL